MSGNFKHSGLILLSGVDSAGVTEKLFGVLAPFNIEILDFEQVVIRERLILTVLIGLDIAHQAAIEEDLLNAFSGSAGQTLYLYAQNNFGSGWVNNANSGKSYLLPNPASSPTQIVYANAVTRVAGQQVRYLIYSNGNNITLQTTTLPGVSPTVYVPAIRIQYSG